MWAFKDSSPYTTDKADTTHKNGVYIQLSLQVSDFSLTLRFGVAQHFKHLSVDRVLSQGPHHVATLAVADLPISCPVEQQERLLKLCGTHRHEAS